jgi:hypothetical protein
MKTREIALLLVVALLLVCLIVREPATIIVVLPSGSQPDQAKIAATVQPAPAPKFHGFALA